MNLPSPKISTDIAFKKFATNVGLITSNGPYGNNIMAAEWTYNISSSGLILVGIGNNKATFQNIFESGEFGVNIAAYDQSSIASIAGNNSGKTTNKIKALKELDVHFYKAETIDVLMLKGASMNAECKLVEIINLIGRDWFIGQVNAVSSNEKPPLIYHSGKYWNLGSNILKPDADKLSEIEKVIRNFRWNERTLCN